MDYSRRPRTQPAPFFGIFDGGRNKIAAQAYLCGQAELMPLYSFASRFHNWFGYLPRDAARLYMYLFATCFLRDSPYPALQRTRRCGVALSPRRASRCDESCLV